MTITRNYCKRFNTTIKATSENGNLLVFRPRCKMWACPYCAIKNMKLWRYRIMLECEKTKQNVWFFWTFTLDGRDHESNNPQSYSLQKWRDIWDKLMKRIKRDMKKFSKNMRYVRVFESHKSGILHVHMLSDVAYSDILPVQQWNKITNQWDTVWHSEKLLVHLEELNLGKIHDVRPINTENPEENGVARNVSAYITKYLTKDIQGDLRDVLKLAGMARVRILQTSQNFGKIEEIESDLQWSRDLIKKWEFDSLSDKQKARDITRGIDLKDNDFGEYDHYPNRDSDLQWIAELMDKDSN